MNTLEEDCVIRIKVYNHFEAGNLPENNLFSLGVKFKSRIYIYIFHCSFKLIILWEVNHSTINFILVFCFRYIIRKITILYSLKKTCVGNQVIGL